MLPVNVILSTPSWCASVAPANSPRPVTMLNTPSGRPASHKSSPNRSATSDVSSDGLMMMVFPVARPARPCTEAW